MPGRSRTDIVVLDSITAALESHRGRVVIAGSHGGAYCGWLAARARLRGVLLNDAGIGLDRAGVGALALLDKAGVPAAAIDYRSARIGDGADMAARGSVSIVNDCARALGAREGMGAILCASLFEAATLHDAQLAPPRETRTQLSADNGAGIEVMGLDSNSLVKAEDACRIVVTGSHGGLLGGRPASAIRLPVRAAVYNDAGGGADDAGWSRLPALDARGIPAMTVGCMTARIGDARSAWLTGIVSVVNARAQALGIRPGMPLPRALSRAV
jgi:hypothetical protein